MASSDVKVLLLRTAGTNCDRELAHAFTLAGASVDTLHINALLADPTQLAPYQILGFPGGFSYGDDIASGKILANQLIHHLQQPLKQFIAEGKLILGICNGFQVLVKSGLLPGPLPQLTSDDWHPTTLTYNHSGKFEDRWTTCKSYSTLCKWIAPGKTLALPIAHGEGRFVTRDEAVLKALVANDQIVFKYIDPQTGEPTQQFPENPNGSTSAIAGICDITGRVLGLMPHPERISDPLNHPLHNRQSATVLAQADGLQLFQTAVQYVRDHQPVAIS